MGLRADKWRLQTIRHWVIEMNRISIWFGMPSKRFSRKPKFSSTDHKTMDLLTRDPIWMLTLIWVRKLSHTLVETTDFSTATHFFLPFFHRRSLVQFATNQKYYGRAEDDGGTEAEEGQNQLEKCVRRSSIGFVSVGTGHLVAWWELHIFVRHGIVCGGELPHQGLHQSIANRWDFITHASLTTEHDKRFQFTAHSMIVFLKNWQYEIQKNESNVFDFSTYQLTILVLWYFQLWKYLPSVKSLQSSTNKLYCGGMWTQEKNTKILISKIRKCIISPFDISDAQIDYKKPIKTIKPTTNLLNNYVLEFFDFFGNQYSPRKDLISVYYGKLLKRNYTGHSDTDNWE